MDIRIVVGDGGTHREVELRLEPCATLAQVAVAIGLDPAAGLIVDGRLHRAGTDVVAARLVHGSLVEPAPTTRAEQESGWLVAVVGGLDAGPTRVLGPGRHLVGRPEDRQLGGRHTTRRGPTVTVAVDDATVAPLALVVEVEPGGGVTLWPMASVNPVLVEGRVLRAGRRVLRSTRLQLGATTLQLVSPEDQGRSPEPGHAPPQDGRVTISGSPAPALPEHRPIVSVPPRDSTVQRLRFDLAALVVPIVLGAVLVWRTGDVRFGVFVLMAPAAAVVSAVASRRRSRRGARRHRRALRRWHSGLAAELRAAAEVERRRREIAAPDVAEVSRRAAGGGEGLWTRRDGEAVTLRLGRGPMVWDPPLVRPHGEGSELGLGWAEGGTELPAAMLGAEPAEVLAGASVLPESPVSVALATGETLAVVGPPAAVAAVARSLVLQAACGHRPSRLAVRVELGDPAWAWVRWLPHTTVGAASGAPGGAPVTLVLRSTPSTVAAGPGEIVVLLADRRHTVGPDCTVLLEVDSDLGDGRLTGRSSAESCDRVALDGVGARHAADTARLLARFDEGADRGCADADGPRLGGLLGWRGDTPTEGELLTSWASAPDGLPVVLGAAGGEPVRVDLATDGPHALVAGTTGSGKSELLRTLVVAAATALPPARLALVLIDYKGGATFEPLRGLPHVVGWLTDLDDDAADRFIGLLTAEITARERRLGDAGAADLVAYRRAGEPCGALPRLLVIVDELAALVAERPGFVDAMVAVAQRGRSLGVHLVVATQRPSGVVTPAVRANTDLRLALRVADDADAVDVVGDVAPARFPRTRPGRAMLRRGGGDGLVTFDVAPVAGTPRRAPGTVTVLGAGEPPPAHRGADTGAVSAQVCAAVRDAAAAWSGPPGQDPWPPSLPAELAWDDLERGFGVADEPARQRWVPLVWEPSDGHVALYGTPGSGVHDGLVAAVLAAVTHHRGQVHVHVVDGSGRLAALRGLPQCGGVALPGSGGHVVRLLGWLVSEIERRQTAPSAADMPQVLAVDDVGGLLAALERHDPLRGVELLARVLSEGPAVGVAVALAADRPAALPARLGAQTAVRVVLRLADPGDAAALGVRRPVPAGAPPGRGRDVATGLLVQLAAPSATSVARAGAGPPATAPVCIRELPTRVVASQVSDGGERTGRGWRVPLGVGGVTGTEHCAVALGAGTHLAVVGPVERGATALLATLGAVVREVDADAAIVGLCSPGSELWDAGALDAAGTGDEMEPLLARLHDDAHAGRRVLVLVEDVAGVGRSGEWLRRIIAGRVAGRALVAAASANVWRGASAPWALDLRRQGTAVLLGADPPADADVVGRHLARHTGVGPVGRAVLVAPGRCDVLQLAVAPAGACRPDPAVDE